MAHKRLLGVMNVGAPNVSYRGRKSANKGPDRVKGVNSAGANERPQWS
ncbi:hypothetical protein BQ8482_180403 [Mesorhizobium delmotii]|uniref:Uncharacterized protein n=1 Tax=Mesorhizobium delmotii TaxID=1631247 RepID=A0A2P9AJ68_9HYPH|nr:hypothetical protein BQ8482_180403 [Mesorhizobium delmotii]